MGKHKLYLDNYALNRPFDDKEQLTVEMEAAAKLHIQDEIRGGKYENVLRVEAVKILIESLGSVNTERFIR